MAKKRFDMILSKKCTDGIFISVGFGTELDEDTKDLKKLAQKVYEATMADFIMAQENNALVSKLMDEIQKTVEQEEKMDPKSMEGYE